MENFNNLLFQIPIINYHKIETTHDIGITTRTPVQFKDDMLFLQKNNFIPITFKDIISLNQLPKKPVIITFDDGYQSFYKSAYPVLQEINFKAVIYIPVNYINCWNDWDVQYYKKIYKHLSEEQLVELHKSGMEIASHTMSHRMLTYLDKKQIEYEVRESKEKLENIINNSVISISYPFNRFNETVLRCVQKAHYSFGVASLYYRNLKNEYRPLALKRFNIYRIDNRRNFSRKTEKKSPKFLKLRDWLIQKGGLATNIAKH